MATTTLESKTENELLEMFRQIISAPGEITDPQLEDILDIAKEFERRALWVQAKKKLVLELCKR